jgi:hypothetical protein
LVPKKVLYASGEEETWTRNLQNEKNADTKPPIQNKAESQENQGSYKSEIYIPIAGEVGSSAPVPGVIGCPPGVPGK